MISTAAFPAETRKSLAVVCFSHYHKQIRGDSKSPRRKAANSCRDFPYETSGV
jgi:hypothetical protein